MEKFTLTLPQAIQTLKYLREVKIPLKYGLVHILRDELEHYYGDIIDTDDKSQSRT